MRHVILYPGENSYWIAECPSLPGCISQGHSEREALEGIVEAIGLWLLDASDHGERIPDDRPVSPKDLAHIPNKRLVKRKQVWVDPWGSQIMGEEIPKENSPQLEEDELSNRRAVVDEINALQARLFKKYGQMPDSVALIRKDRDR